ncbi:MAB_1171c family putative transporter [Amycolatopsis sp. NPDC049688]|uniref:MAB_1171c family putative transporter n=1 Tax=Amycolatopsis sp. NPDC049688 TaxID=3154733 RepID=UPI003449094E
MSPELPVFTVPVVSAAALAVLWLVVMTGLPRLLRSVPQRAVTAFFAFLLLSAPTSLPGVRRAVDSVTGVPDLTILLGHLGTLLAFIAILELAAGVEAGRRVLLRRGQLAFTLVMTGLVTLFVFIPRRLDQPDFGLWQVRHPLVVTYQVLFQTCLGLGLSLAVAFLVPYWRKARRGPLRKALLLLWLSAAVGLLYVASRMWYVVGHGFGFLHQVARPVYGTVTFLLLWTAVALAGSAALVRVGYAVTRHVRHRIAYHRLGGLWRTLTEAVPGTVLDPRSGPFPARAFRRRLYRRIIEIRDAQMELTGYVAPEEHQAAEAALRGREAAVLDACVLRLGLRSKDEGGAGPHESRAGSRTTDGTVDDELADLLRLRLAMDDPEVVRTVAGIPAPRPS